MMGHLAYPGGLVGLICGLLAIATPATAATPVTYVSGTGSDANNCVTAPCASFQVAHDKTDAGGVIIVVSSGSFGPVKITKAISILAHGVTAQIRSGVACAGGGENPLAGVCVNADANDVVRLRGLTIDLASIAGSHGIRFLFGAALHVQNCLVQNAARNGINAHFASAGPKLYVSDTTVVSNGDSGITVHHQGTGSFKASMVRVRLEKNKVGIFQFSQTRASSIVRDSLVAGNTNDGIVVNTNFGISSTAMIERTSVLNNDDGIIANDADTTVRVANSTVTGNAKGVNATNGAVIFTYPGNMLEGNGDDSTAQLRPVR